MPAAGAEGGPRFEDPVLSPGGGPTGAGFGPSSIASADFDGDGHVDLAVVSWLLPPGVFVYTNLGNGTFDEAVRYDVPGPLAPRPVSGVGAFPVVAADFDGDGHVDLAIGNAGTNNISVLANTGSGGFAPAGSYPSVGSPHDMVVADLNGDGTPDLAATNPLGGTVTILLGDGAGGFSTTSVAAPFPTTIVAGDLDNDGNIDLVTFGGFGGNAHPLIGDGRGSFTPGTPIDMGGINEGAAIGDGRADLIVASATGEVLVALGNGDGRFAAPVATPLGAALDVAIVHLDGDEPPTVPLAAARLSSSVMERP
ncbi:MAG: FG-GAP repeat domain-containing protein [Acidimicrobiales bacterium]